MDKILLIIKREYTSRVMKKSFLLVTILTPLSIVLIGLASGYFASRSASKLKIAVVDESKVITAGSLKDKSNVYVIENQSFDSLKNSYQEKNYDMVLRIPSLDSLSQRDMALSYISEEKLSIATLSSMENEFEDIIEEHKLVNSTISKETLDNLKVKINLENALKNEEGKDNVKGDTSSKMSSVIATALSYLMGFMMYMVIFIFGSMVMRSVMEEKVNRIVEVMVSTVKPFQLLLGKIIGVGLVGLTQLLIWMILIPLGMMIVSSIFGFNTAQPDMAVAGGPEMQEIVSNSQGKIAEVLLEIKKMNWWLIVPAFIAFFLGGYFIYSTLFAAVGASIGDDMTEGQQLMLPIIAPVIIAFVMLSSVLRDPNGGLAVFGSMFPLFSPIIMPARLPFDPPVWQVILSLVILIASIAAITWLAARIYRVGIFMYGKKASFQDLAKWITWKN